MEFQYLLKRANTIVFSEELKAEDIERFKDDIRDAAGLDVRIVRALLCDMKGEIVEAISRMNAINDWDKDKLRQKRMRTTILITIIDDYYAFA